MQTSSDKELAEIQASVHGLADNVDLVKKGRRFIMKDEFIKLKKTGPTKNRSSIYLFNDMILFTEKGSKKSNKYVDHMHIKDILFIETADSLKEKFVFGIMDKGDKRKQRFVAKDGHQKTTWKQKIEYQIEKYCPTDTTFDQGESMVVYGSPSDRNSGSYSSMADLCFGMDGSLGSHSELESGDGSTNGDSPPPNDMLLNNKDDWSSSDGDEGSSFEDTDEARSEGDDSECECKILPQSDGSTIFSHANLHTVLWYLTNHGDFNDPILIKTFLHSCMAYTTPESLFDNLMQIYNLTIPVPKIITVRYSLCDTRRRVTCFIKIWMEFFFERDFNTKDRTLFTKLLDFFNELNKNGTQAEANILKLVIIRVNKKRLVDKGHNRFEAMMVRSSPAPKLSSRSGHSTAATLSSSSENEPRTTTEVKPLDFNVTTLAEQFVLIEFSLFKAVALKELSNLAWKSEQPRKTALNVVNIFNRFDLVSQWVATEVVMAHSPKQRVIVIEKLIQLAQKCLELRNYNSLMEIIAGLNRGSVQRMKKTWEVVSHASKDNFRFLNSVVDSLQNYKNYREQLKKSILPCLPYFGIFLRDLTFTDVGNPGKIGDNINFEKIYMTSRILKDIQHYQRTSYNIEEDEVLLPLLRRLLAMPEEMLYKHSQTIEPSNTLSFSTSQ